MENIQKIQDFLNNRLSAEEKSAFEKEMKENPILANDVLLHQQLHQVLAYQNLFSMQETVKSIAAETPIEPDFEGYKSLLKQRKWWQNWRFGVISVALVAVLAGSIWLFQNRAEHAKMQAIAAPYWSEVFDYAVRIDEADKSPFAQGMRAYKSADYVTAAAALERHLSQKTDDRMTRLYLGIAYALSQQQEKAIENLSPLAASNDELASSARWYLALCYLRNGDKQLARQWLSALKNDVIYGEKAQKTLKEL